MVGIMRIGIPRESLPGEQRVAATPKTVPQLIKLGYSVVIEHGAGERASYLDDDYIAAGAELADTGTVWGSDIVMAVNEPSVEELGAMRPGATPRQAVPPSRIRCSRHCVMAPTRVPSAGASMSG